MAGHFQAQLVRAGGQDEVVQGRRLALPPEPPEAAVRQPAHPPLDLGEPRELPFLGREQHRVGDGVDQPRAEDRRGVPRRLPAARRSPRDCPPPCRTGSRSIAPRVPWSVACRWITTLEPPWNPAWRSLRSPTNTLPSFSALGWAGDGRQHEDVAIVPTRPADAAEVVACHARGFVIERPEAVAAGRAGLSRLPDLHEQLPAFVELSGVRRLGPRAAASRHGHRAHHTSKQPALSQALPRIPDIVLAIAS